MNNCTGYIRVWEPHYQSGVIFGCDGGADGLNVAFRCAEINDPKLQRELAVRPTFELARDCDTQPDDVLVVSFFYDGSGYANNIVARQIEASSADRLSDLKVRKDEG